MDEDRIEGGDAQSDREEEIGEEAGHAPAAMHIVLDDHLHAEPHVPQDGEEGRASPMAMSGCLTLAIRVGAVDAEMAKDEDDEEQDERDVGDRGDALQPPMLGAGFGGAKAQDACRAVFS